MIEVASKTSPTGPPKGSPINHLLKLSRPKQWLKNVFVFSALFFSHNLLSGEALRATILAFVSFCLVSSTVYVLNDLVDIEKDRAHPVKRHRPLAAGVIRKRTAALYGLFLLVISLGLATSISPALTVISLVYLSINLAYSFWLKHVVLVDVFVIAGGFVLRVLAGAAAIAVVASPWLLLCTLLLALFLGICKRRAEVRLLKAGASSHRKILDEYNPELLDQLISLVAASTIMAYSMYTFNSPQGTAMMYTVPFVLFALFRYLYLVYREDRGGEPANILVGDRPFLVSCLLWLVTTFGVIYLQTALPLRVLL